MSDPRFTRRALMRGVLAVGAAAGTALMLTGCGEEELIIVPSDDHADDIGAEVVIIDNAYVDETVTITAGQAVRWVWQGTNEHDVVADDRSFVSELQTEGTYTHIFDEPGEYPYLCSIHPEMRGTVIVM